MRERASSGASRSKLEWMTWQLRRVLGGARLAKFDVKGMYWTVPVHPDDRWLLGMCWRGKIYVDKVLPFGLQMIDGSWHVLETARFMLIRCCPSASGRRQRSNAVADGLKWILKQDIIH